MIVSWAVTLYRSSLFTGPGSFETQVPKYPVPASLQRGAQGPWFSRSSYDVLLSRRSCSYAAQGSGRPAVKYNRATRKSRLSARLGVRASRIQWFRDARVIGLGLHMRFWLTARLGVRASWVQGIRDACIDGSGLFRRSRFTTRLGVRASWDCRIWDASVTGSCWMCPRRTRRWLQGGCRVGLECKTGECRYAQHEHQCGQPPRSEVSPLGDQADQEDRRDGGRNNERGTSQPGHIGCFSVRGARSLTWSDPHRSAEQPFLPLALELAGWPVGPHGSAGFLAAS